jgi:hypothetical protein
VNRIGCAIYIHLTNKIISLFIYSIKMFLSDIGSPIFHVKPSFVLFRFHALIVLFYLLRIFNLNGSSKYYATFELEYSFNKLWMLRNNPDKSISDMFRIYNVASSMAVYINEHLRYFKSDVTFGMM